jgi:hypothetical protein
MRKPVRYGATYGNPNGSPASPFYPMPAIPDVLKQVDTSSDSLGAVNKGK